MGEFFIRIWRALTAAGRSFALGSVEAWGFWSTTLLLLGLLIYLMEIAGGVTWRMIEGRLRPRMRDQEAAARLRQTILELKADLLDSERERARLAEVSAEQERVIEANRSWARNWNADAGRVKAGAR
ncbi:MAG TPA: hypothetical protein VJ553_04965 [Candidatus Paceibacterota bacterium]|nr:hypothetical protein [Candidatus Paceibacterota bacterium]